MLETGHTLGLHIRTMWAFKRHQYKSLYVLVVENLRMNSHMNKLHTH